MTYVIIIILGIFTASKFSRLSGRVESLERKLNDVSQLKINNGIQESHFQKEQLSDHELLQENYDEKPIQEISTSESNWFSEDWLLKIGSLLLLLSFSWFVRYAFINDWVSESGRIYIGVIFGIALMLYGWSQIGKGATKRENRGTIFALLGSAIVILSMFAARELYELFTPASSLLVMFLTVVFISYLGVIYKNMILYTLGFILAIISPLLLNIESPNYMNLFLYLLVICFGALWVDFLTKKSNMSVIALLAYTFYSLPHLFGIISHSTSQLAVYAYIFTGIFLLIGIINFIKKSEYLEANSIVLYGSMLLFITWVIRAAGGIEKVSIFIALLVSLASGLLVYYFTEKKNILFMYIGVAVALLGVLTTLHFSGEVLIIAYIIEVFIISFLIFGLLGELRATRTISYLFIVPVLMSLGNIKSLDWSVGVLHDSFLVLAVLGLSLFLTGLFISTKKTLYSRNEASFDLNKSYSIILITLGSIYFYILLWLSLHALIFDQNATIISLIVYIIIGLIIYFYGIFQTKKYFELYGKIMLIVVLARLFVVDVWGMEFIGRIITFFVVGMLLMATTFLKKKDNRLLS